MSFTYADLQPLCKPFLPGLQVGMLTNELRATLSRFILESEVWREELASIDLVAAQHDYAVASVSYSGSSSVQRIVWVKLGDSTVTDWDQMPKLHTDLYSLLFAEEKMRLAWTPSASVTSGLRVKVVLRLKLTQTTVPDWIIERYGQYIANGAIAVLKLQPGMPYYDPKGSVDQANLYEFGVSLAKNEVIKEGKQQTSRVTPVDWFSL